MTLVLRRVPATQDIGENPNKLEKAFAFHPAPTTKREQVLKHGAHNSMVGLLTQVRFHFLLCRIRFLQQMLPL